MLSTGLREVIGSWNTMDIWAPRTSRICSSLTSRRSRPSNRMRPPVTRPGGLGTRRRIDSALTDLPQPDSPTMATVSPGVTE